MVDGDRTERLECSSESNQHTMPDTASLLTTENLECTRDDRLLFNGLSFSLDSGEVLQIEGPNGSGKTTSAGKLSYLWRQDGMLLYRNGLLLAGAKTHVGQCEGLLTAALEACERLRPGYVEARRDWRPWRSPYPRRRTRRRQACWWRETGSSTSSSRPTTRTESP